MDDLVERILARVVVQDDGCWVWPGATGGDEKHRYGVIADKQQGWRLVTTHRTMYEHAKGPIPAGLVIDHLCRQPRCCNPDHLEAVTQRENLLRGQTVNAAAVAQTHCIHGHSFDEANTYRPPGQPNKRMCRTCAAERQARKPKHPRRPQTHCKHGHPYDEANTYTDPKGGRRCRECHRIEIRRRAL